MSYWPPPPPPPVRMSATIWLDEPASALFDPPDFLPPPPPQPAAVKASAPTRSVRPPHPRARFHSLFIVLLPSRPRCRSRVGVLGATRGGPPGPWRRAPRPRRSRGSA